MTCGKMISSKYKKYLKQVAIYDETFHDQSKEITKNTAAVLDDPQYRTPEDRAMDDVHLTKYCCRRHFLSHTNTIDVL
jgi:DNA-directed RNA polymerase subunit N (RpoN/RPB10)